VKTVTTASTFPPQGLFTKDAQTIARALASKRVSPKGAGSGLRMLSFFINRAGHQLSASRRAELERAKRLMKTRLARAATYLEEYPLTAARATAAQLGRSANSRTRLESGQSASSPTW